MSPDSASCSTRCGIGVCGGGSSSTLARPRRGRPTTGSIASVAAVSSTAGLAAALLDLAVLEHGRVVRRVVGVDVETRVVGGAAATARPDRLGGQVALVVSSSTWRPRARSRVSASLDGHLVERGAGDDEDPEEGEQHQHRDDDGRRAEQVEQQRRDDVPDRAAALAQRAGVAGDGLRAVVGDVHDAEHAEGERDPADDLTTGRAVLDRVAQVAPGRDDQGERDEPADLADGAGHGDADARPSGRRRAGTRPRPR